MRNESNIRRDKHYIFRLHVHWVFVAKYRRRVFDARAIDVLRSVFSEVRADAQAARVEMDGEGDHVHLPISIVRQYNRRVGTDIHDNFSVAAILRRPEARGLPRVLVSSPVPRP
jgi:uncharacterized membrane protein